MTEKVQRSDQLLAFIFGVIFLVVILAMAILRPEPTPFEYTVFRVTLALAAAGVGAVLPGFIYVQISNWVRAGGALGLFLLVYLVSPVAMSDINPNPSESRDNPIPVAQSWLELIDGGRYEEAYSQTAPLFRERFNRSAMVNLLQGERTVLGDVVSRRFAVDQPWVNPPGVTPGAYRAIGFVTRFSRHDRPIYEAVQLRSEPSGWKVIGFSTQIRTDSGNFVPFVPEDT